MKNSIYLPVVLILAASITLTACGANNDPNITASGTLSALEVPISPETGGQVMNIDVSEGNPVQTGDTLFTIDDRLLRAQLDQAKAAQEAAVATLEAAQAQLLSAQSQKDLAVQGARAQDMQARQKSWEGTVEEDFQPIWYFQKTELITAAQAEVETASDGLNMELVNLKEELKKASNQDFIAVEKRLAQAQAAFDVAQTTLDQAKLANDEDLTDAAQDNLDKARSEFDMARKDYQSMLSSSAADSVLRARARVAVARSRYDNARDALMGLQTGDESEQVRVAETAVEQAQAAVNQAEANVSQAKAAVALIEIQLEHTIVKAPIDGVLMARNLEVGEIATPGGIVMTISRLENLKLIVYVPEDRYGKIAVGQKVTIAVDSYAGQIFEGNVVHIADKAEYTPRNVQTVEGRESTVYAVEIVVPNPDLQLKPGMPADVTFVERAG
jgi:HlyD family secretion protein